MADLLTLYRDNAQRAQDDADAATLDNVRDRNLRAAMAWQQMADRVATTERARAAREPHGDPALRILESTAP
ncbi:hypothetical protein [Sphingomonas sp.]|jgi:hypothetical protein|uniref:hypothetical protein n=1 Tax=Sphingomonas sp. TaxID=28214 RepID=UPI002EDB660D